MSAFASPSVFRRVCAGLPLLLALSLAGCLESFLPGSAVELPHTAPNDPFPVGEAESMFSAAYHSIATRAYKAVDMNHVATEGINGLAQLDPDLSAAVENDRLVLRRAGRPVSDFAAPGYGDSEGWAQVTLGAAIVARQVSPAVAEADEEQIYEAVLDAATASLDRFSRYLNPTEAREAQANRNGFNGVGIRFQLTDGTVEILEVFSESPAARAGLRVGDRIVEIAGHPVAGMTSADVRANLRGPTATTVQVMVRSATERGPAPTVHPVLLSRAHVTPETVTLSYLNDIPVLTLTGFNQNTTHSVLRALRQAKDDLGPWQRGMVLDLRGNPGGLLDQAVEVADIFIADGVIVFTKGRHTGSNQLYNARSGDPGESLPLVVLIDGNSASAAEILAAALQDNGRAVVVGSVSFGKGSVQTVPHLPNDGEMALTWSLFHAPSGYALHELGVLPSVCTADKEGSTPADGETLARLQHLESGPIATAMTHWRGVDLEDHAGRANLRQTCAPTDLEGSERELRLARGLLRDSTLYAQALAVGSQHAAR